MRATVPIEKSSERVMGILVVWALVQTLVTTFSKNVHIYIYIDTHTYKKVTKDPLKSDSQEAAERRQEVSDFPSRVNSAFSGL